MKRSAGILFPIFSLPSSHGIGCFSREAYEFIDFLEASGQGFWQILPIGPTGYGDSPYQPLSAFAGNPYFISFDALKEEKLLEEGEAEAFSWGPDETKVDYGALYENRPKVLKKAFERFSEQRKASPALEKEYKAYLKKEEYWLPDYALFMAIKEANDQACWLDWEEGLRKREKKALEKAKKELKEEIEYYLFLQFIFDRQWEKLKEYAEKKKVRIIGDMPFYVSLDSADAWSHPEVFQMDQELLPKAVAGCPPDAFSADGQLWGNPLYDWKALKESNYAWWMERIRRNYEFYDVIRVDHFHGFSEYYAVPYGEKTARKGTMEKGPGMEFIRVLKKTFSSPELIAEDLGNNTPENEKLLKDSGFPGMKVLQYAFTSWDSYYVNHKHTENSVVYTGTHDNTPSMAWVQEIQEGEREFAREYINSKNTDYGAFVWDFIREAYRSVAVLCIIPLQDYLCLGREARLNTPGTREGNWQWRLKPHFLSRELESSIRKLSEIYGRS